MRPRTLVINLMKAGFSQQGISEFTNISQGHLSRIKNDSKQNLREDAQRRLESMYERRKSKTLTKYRRKNKVRQKGV